jgi:hypothetical protein
MPFKYRKIVLSEMARHGIMPREDTPPELIHEYINDLYRYEVRRLRASMLAGGVPRQEYAAHVERLRSRYPLLSLPTRYWREAD